MGAQETPYLQTPTIYPSPFSKPSWASRIVEAADPKVQIPPRFAGVIEAIRKSANKHGRTVYAVGGFVRDLLMEREPNDLDVMVEGENGGIEFAKELAGDYELHEPVVFPRFGTAMVQLGDEKVEFVMPRKEYYSEESRKPETELGTIEQDALRRDFGINALFLRLNDMELLDLTGHGMQDIEKKVIRVTDPRASDVIFSQDPLRMMRAIRLALQLGFEIAQEDVEAIQRNAHRLEIISKERIRDELSKLLVQAAPSRGIRFLRETGLLKYVMPELEAEVGTGQPAKWHDKDVFEHTMAVLDTIPADLISRLSALLHDIGKPVTHQIIDGLAHFFGHEDVGSEMSRDILRRLKFPNEVSDQVALLVKQHMRPHHYEKEWSDSAVRRFVRGLGDNLERSLQLAEADVAGAHPEKVEEGATQIKEFRQRIEELQKVKPVSEIQDLVSGDELMQLFNQPQGRWIKVVKEHLQEAQLNNPNLTKDQATEMAKKYVMDNPDVFQVKASWVI
jgi:putative nucleotidyltransferase with HDIG domain